MRKLNVWRMRKHILRNTPDTLSFTVDPLEWGSQSQAEHRVDQFEKIMQLKHGNKLEEVLVQTFNDGMDNIFMIKARAILRR